MPKQSVLSYYFQENLHVASGNRGYVVENHKLDDEIKHFGETGSFGSLF